MESWKLGLALCEPGLGEFRAVLHLCRPNLLSPALDVLHSMDRAGMGFEPGFGGCCYNTALPHCYLVSSFSLNRHS